MESYSSGSGCKFIIHTSLRVPSAFLQLVCLPLKLCLLLPLFFHGTLTTIMMSQRWISTNNNFRNSFAADLLQSKVLIHFLVCTSFSPYLSGVGCASIYACQISKSWELATLLHNQGFMISTFRKSLAEPGGAEGWFVCAWEVRFAPCLRLWLHLRFHFWYYYSCCVVTLSTSFIHSFHGSPFMVIPVAPNIPTNTHNAEHGPIRSGQENAKSHSQQC